MAELPTYQQSVDEKALDFTDHVPGSAGPQRFSIRDEISISRSQHVAVLISRVLPSIKERARQGISRSTLLLIPSDQAESCAKGQLVGFSDDLPVLIQLEGRFDSSQFWAQREALDLLREKMLEAVCGEIPTPKVEEQRLPPPPAKTSYFGRKQTSKAADTSTTTQRLKSAPVSIEVCMDQVSFRSENEYGLFDTARARAVHVTVHARTRDL